MKTIAKILTTCTLATAITAFVSCDKRESVIGTWSATPVQLVGIPPTASASMQLSLSFDKDALSRSDKNGDVTFSALISAESNNAAYASSYGVAVAASATMTGRWTYEDNDDDDILITLDPQTLQIKVDQSGVIFSPDQLSSMQQASVDSLAAVTAQEWQGYLKQPVSNEFYRIQKLSDVEIRNGIMSCEINDADLIMRKTVD